MKRNTAQRSMTGGLVLALSLAGLAQAAGLPPRAPGLWQSTTSVTGPGGVPMAQAQNVIVLSCVDAATDQKFLLSGQNRCPQLTVSGSGTNYTIDGICSQPAGAVTIHETLNYANDKAVQLKADFKTTSGDMSMTSSLQWLGPCLAGMQPGDEGTMAGVGFAKSGNINDSGP